MLKMILADDEPVITRGIKQLVDWKSFGVDIIGTYSDGKSALNAIIENEPDIAILDISMPEKTGIDILTDLSKMNIKTNVIFLSGFQDFTYVHSALQYGAIDYLLKPVQKDELLKAIAKILDSKGVGLKKPLLNESTLPPLSSTANKKLIKLQTDSYTLVLCELIIKSKSNALETELMKFSASSVMESFLEKENIGISFWHEKQCCVALKHIEKQNLLIILDKLKTLLKKQSDIDACFIVVENIKNISDIPNLIEKHSTLLEKFYFYPLVQTNTIFAKDIEQEQIVDVSCLCDMRDELVEKIIAQDATATAQILKDYLKTAGFAAQGDKQSAAFFAISCVRYVDNELRKRFVTEELLVQENVLLEKFKTLNFYEDLQNMVFAEFDKMLTNVASNTKNNSKQDVLKAVEYINKNYSENLSLDILAKHIHMNSFYFSSFFKKQTGKNFKDYLNEVRMSRAMDLLVTTNYKSYEIADKVGFKDYRYFTELFSKFYGKTPTAYRKDLLKK